MSTRVSGRAATVKLTVSGSARVHLTVETADASAAESKAPATATKVALPVLGQAAPPDSRKRDRTGEPRMPRATLRRIAARVMKAASLRRAAAILRAEAATAGGDWTKYMRRLARGLSAIHARSDEFRTPHPVFSLKGNKKLPFAAFSALPEVTCPGAGECLTYCYSFTAWRYPAAWCRQVQNTLLLKFAPHVVANAFVQLDQGLTVRLYVDGDFDSARTIDFWFGLLWDRPDLKAYGYSKSWDLLWEHAQTNELPDNYRLNLSSGGKAQAVTAQQMCDLSITRGEFVAVPIDYRPAGKRGKVGFERYTDRQYHRAVRAAAEARLGSGRVFSCPGKCGECSAGNHACGSDDFRGLPIVIGVH